MDNRTSSPAVAKGRPMLANPRSTWLMDLLNDRAVLALAVLLAVAVAVILYVERRDKQHVVEAIVRADAQAYSDALLEVRSLYTSEVVKAVRAKGIPVTHDYSAREGAIPLPATLTIELAQRIGKRNSGDAQPCTARIPSLGGVRKADFVTSSPGRRGRLSIRIRPNPSHGSKVAVAVSSYGTPRPTGW